MNGTSEPLSDERLDEIQTNHATYTARHAHDGSFACCSAHVSADAVPELLAEVERLRVVNVANIRDYDAALLAIHEARDHWQAQTVAEWERAEKAEAERDVLAQRVAELEGTEPEMQYRATGLRVTVGITEEDLLEDGWDGWTLEQRVVRPGPWTPVDVAKVGAR